MAFWATGTMLAVTAYSANESAKQQNKQADVASENSRRRYAIDTGVAEDQMEEQSQLALEKMTDISKAYIKAKGTATAVQAESGVGGNVDKRLKATSKIKTSEAKGKVAKEINTNVINIAQGMLAKKIDTESMIAEANSKRRNVALDTIIGGIEGGASGYMLGSAISNAGSGSVNQTKGTFDFNQTSGGI